MKHFALIAALLVTGCATASQPDWYKTCMNVAKAIDEVSGRPFDLARQTRLHNECVAHARHQEALGQSWDCPGCNIPLNVTVYLVR